ncbi:MAG: hypothetical protein RIR70_2119 [Pseudomonadota bacterium]
MVPNLTAALTHPLLALEAKVLAKEVEIEQWFRAQWAEHTPPFYSSVDLRNAGFKLAPVDTNLFPGGFNNLNRECLPLCVQAAMSAIEKFCPDAKKLLLIPESHTRNQFYLQNVIALSRILRHTGLEVRLGSVLPEITEPTTITLDNGAQLVLEPLVRSRHRLGLKDFDPCAILLNNDLSGGVPAVLEGLHEQTLLPPLHAGWHVRRKSHHFAAFRDVAAQFATVAGIDPWLIDPAFGVCGGLDFQAREGEACLAETVDQVLSRIREKYLEYGVAERPFVIVKADAGTYGMGVMTVHDAAEVTHLNRKQRNKMAVGKEGLQVHEVIIQEGVHTLETVGGSVAEPVVYMIDRYVVGGFYRVNPARGRDENLNAPGMHFEPLGFESPCQLPDPASHPDDAPNRFYTYGVVARLAALAAAIELERTAPEEL